MESRYRYIRGDVWKDADGFYRFGLNRDELVVAISRKKELVTETFLLNQAINIPGFAGIYDEENRLWEGGLAGALSPHHILFRVPVANHEPPKCEDCTGFSSGGPFCAFSAVATKRIAGKLATMNINLCWYEREHGQCGPKGKRFVQNATKEQPTAERKSND